MAKCSFGVSTHLYHNYRLSRDHLLEIAAHGFDRVEIFATRTHFDFHSESAVADLQQWLSDAGLALHGVHAPIGESFASGRWGPPLSIASPSSDARAHALEEVERALHIARRLPFGVLVTHLGLPRPAENSRDAARRSVETLAEKARLLGVRLALEVIPNELSRANTLAHFLDEVVDVPETGICLDFGHAHLDGDLVDAVETVSEHLIATHVHDNRGGADDHLVPFEGTIDWDGALTAVQKVGYEGALVFEVAAQGSAKDMLKKLAKARPRMERMLA